jgi:CDGSH-type Zn-finger protein
VPLVHVPLVHVPLVAAHYSSSMPITITIKQNGPYVISAEDAVQTIIVDAAGQVVVPLKPGKGIALCRCGGSVTKPFCDGTHSRIGFKGAEEAQQVFDSKTS